MLFKPSMCLESWQTLSEDRKKLTSRLYESRPKRIQIQQRIQENSFHVTDQMCLETTVNEMQITWNITEGT